MAYSCNKNPFAHELIVDCMVTSSAHIEFLEESGGISSARVQYL